MWASSASDTPTLNDFLSGIADILLSRDGAKLQDFLQLEPPLSPIYNQMISELRQKYPRDSGKDAELLEQCEKLVPRPESGSGSGSGSQWPAFPPFMRLYFTFMRDVNLDNLLDTYDLLKTLLK